MAWMETDHSKHTYFRWKIKWRLEHLGALGTMGDGPFKIHLHVGYCFLFFFLFFFSFFFVACSENRTQSSGFIMSPFYPGYHPSNTHCTWRIKVLAGYVIRLQFIAFELEEHPTCAGNFLEVRDGFSQREGFLGKFCGQSFPTLIESLDNQMMITFKSNGQSSRSGFKIYYTARGR